MGEESGEPPILDGNIFNLEWVTPYLLLYLFFRSVWLEVVKSIFSIEGMRNENAVAPPLLVTAKSPKLIISMPIRTSAFDLGNPP